MVENVNLSVCDVVVKAKASVVVVVDSGPDPLDAEKLIAENTVGPDLTNGVSVIDVVASE